MIINEYKTIEKESEIEYVEKKSKFIGYIKAVNSSIEAINYINKIKAIHYNASHNVYAYIIKDEGVIRYSDDGEPTGTAGIPVLDVLQKSNLTDLVVVVTRYFGGVLLGGGGLVRAYSHTAKLAVDEGTIIKMEMREICKIECTYNQYGKISTLIPQFEGNVEKTDFTEKVIITFNISQDNLKRINKQILEITCGELEAEVCNKRYIKVK